MSRIYPQGVFLTLLAKSKTTGELVGFVTIRLSRYYPPLSRKVLLQGRVSLGVRDDYQRRWIGTRLADEGIKLAAKHNIRKLLFRVHIDNTRAILLWEKKFGCKRVGVIKDVKGWRGNRHNMLEMELDLDKASPK